MAAAGGSPSPVDQWHGSVAPLELVDADIAAVVDVAPRTGWPAVSGIVRKTDPFQPLRARAEVRVSFVLMEGMTARRSRLGRVGVEVEQCRCCRW